MSQPPETLVTTTERRTSLTETVPDTPTSPTPPSSPDRGEIQDYLFPESQAVFDVYPEESLEDYTTPSLPTTDHNPNVDGILDNVRNRESELMTDDPEPPRPDAYKWMLDLFYNRPRYFKEEDGEEPIRDPLRLWEVDPVKAKQLANREIGLDEVEKCHRITQEDCEKWCRELQVDIFF